jgi:nucleotide-binding universal stress UspA family protein
MKIRRIVVGLDFGPQSRPALEAAASLAGDLDAELEALFVESEELLRMAGMPFAREVGVGSASARRLDPAALERTLEAHARQARRALAALAEARPLRWRLRVTRGSVTEELVATATPDDLTVVGIPGWGAEALRLAPETPATLLVLPPSGRFRGPLAAVCPVSVDPQRVVDLLLPLSSAVGDGLTLLVTAPGVEAAKPWCERAGALLEERHCEADLEIVREGQPETLQTALERLAPRAVAILAPPPSAAG